MERGCGDVIHRMHRGGATCETDSQGFMRGSVSNAQPSACAAAAAWVASRGQGVQGYTFFESPTVLTRRPCLRSISVARIHTPLSC